MKAFTFWNPDKPYEEVDVLVDIPLEFEEIEREKVVRRGALGPGFNKSFY